MNKDIYLKLITESIKTNYIISLFLEVDGKKYPKDEYLIILKELIKETKNFIQKQEPEITKNINSDLDTILNYLQYNYTRGSEKTIIIYSSGDRVWEIFKSKVPLRSSLVIRESPYLRPLIHANLLQKKIATILLDRSKANFYLSEYDNISLLQSINNEVPQKVKAAGYKGYAGKKVERHVEEHIQKHFKTVYEEIIKFCNKNQCDNIIIGGEKRNIDDFTSYMPNIWTSRIISKINIPPEADIKDVSSKIFEAINNYHSSREIFLIEKIKQEARSKALGAYGIEAVFDAIRHKQISTLAVQQNFSLPGKKCKNCTWLTINLDTCQLCAKPMSFSQDIIDEAINESILQNADIYIISFNPARISEIEGIGALLRFHL